MEIEVSLKEYELMRLLARNGRMTGRDIGRQMTSSDSYIYLMTKKLIAAELICCEKDGRTNKYKLTAEGMMVLENIFRNNLNSSVRNEYSKI